MRSPLLLILLLSLISWHATVADTNTPSTTTKTKENKSKPKTKGNQSTTTTSTTSEEHDENFDAIKSLHAVLDDDQDGIVNHDESADYMRENELEDTDTKQNYMFIDDSDQQISVDELWVKWTRNKVYKWSVEEVIHWLKYTVYLPEYARIFRQHKVNGKQIPRLATPQDSYLQKELKISNVQHRRKIYIRASDLILFGVPADYKPLQSDKSFLAIRAVHQHLDDDSDGSIDTGESQEYLDEELEASSSKRHLALHTHDNFISVDELWESWQESPVYSWTTDQVIDWLKNVVGLPQYEKKFRQKKINGKCIPRIATDKSSFLQIELGVQNPRHRRKIYLRASDIILFGAPEIASNHHKDMVIAIIVLISTLLCLYAFREKRMSKLQIENMSKDLMALQQAEDNLKAMQETLADAEQSLNGENSSEREKLLLEEIEEAKKEAERLHQERNKSQEEKIKLALVEQELSEVRLALAKAELEMKASRTHPPQALQLWLQKTYQMESEYFKLRKDIAMTQMNEAKEACEGVSKARRTMFGSLRLAHGQTIDVVDQKIINAKSALAEVTNMLQERQHRWMEIEDLCQFTIASDGLYGNISKKSRRSSLQKALADVTSLALSVPPTQDTINEEGSVSEKSDVSDVKNSRENSFDSGSGGSSSATSRQVSMISTQSSVLSNKDNSDSVSLGGKSNRRSSNQSISRIRRVSSEKFGNLSDGRKEKKLQRVNTEPIDMSKRALSNAMNGRPRSSGDLKFDAIGGGGGDGQSSSGKIFTAQSVDELNRSASNHSLKDTNDNDGNSTNGDMSDGSVASSVSITTKKKKKGIHGIKNIFHRKQKVDR